MMEHQPIGQGRLPTRPPTSREINQALELLRSVGADAQAMTLLDRWNNHRLVTAAQCVETLEELRNVFAGLPPLQLSAVQKGAWS